MKTNFTVIKGGRTDSPLSGGTHRFLSGIVTNTRLMGTMGMELVWEVHSSSGVQILNQIFHLDAEEFGLETYFEGFGKSPTDLAVERQRMIHTLGGNPVEITEKQARFLIQAHHSINQKFHTSLPEPSAHYAFLLHPQQTLTAAEVSGLYDRICPLWNSADRDNLIINYYLMRAFSGDLMGAAWLTAGARYENPGQILPDELPVCDLSGIRWSGYPATLCRNVIHPQTRPGSYLCESLIEYEEQYHVHTSEIELLPEKGKVLRAETLSEFPISSPEAAMLLNRPEYITVYDIWDMSESFLDTFSQLVMLCTETIYDNGRLYTEFNETNVHVGKSTYLLNDDVHSIYFLSDTGQLILMSYRQQALHDAEFQVAMSMYPYAVVMTGRYEFRVPVLYEFINSTCASFEEFVDLITPDPD